MLPTAPCSLRAQRVQPLPPAAPAPAAAAGVLCAWPPRQQQAGTGRGRWVQHSRPHSAQLPGPPPLAAHPPLLPPAPPSAPASATPCATATQQGHAQVTSGCCTPTGRRSPISPALPPPDPPPAAPPAPSAADPNSDPDPNPNPNPHPALPPPDPPPAAPPAPSAAALPARRACRAPAQPARLRWRWPRQPAQQPAAHSQPPGGRAAAGQAGAQPVGMAQGVRDGDDEHAHWDIGLRESEGACVQVHTFVAVIDGERLPVPPSPLHMA